MKKRGSKAPVKKYNDPKKGMVCVGIAKTWFFRDVYEASRIMGLKVPEIYKQMGSQGKNQYSFRWYTRPVYDKLKKAGKVK